MTWVNLALLLALLWIQHIGVRIPSAQPIRINKLLLSVHRFVPGSRAHSEIKTSRGDEGGDRLPSGSQRGFVWLPAFLPSFSGVKLHDASVSFVCSSVSACSWFFTRSALNPEIRCCMSFHAASVRL